jgi:hypothetical protein
MATNTTRATPTDADAPRPRLTDASPRRSTDMVTTNTPAPASTSDEQVRAAACHMYDAECALHAAHQSHVDAWITAASEKLHQAVGEHIAATAAPNGPEQP